MTSQFFTYDKQKVIQALRYHFITRREIKVMMILVNVFAILSASLFFFKKISPYAFLISSLLWFTLMIVFWFLLPYMVYRKADTFKDRFRAILSDDEFRIENDRGGRSWDWGDFSTWMRVRIFFTCISAAAHSLLYQKMYLKGMMYMKPERYLKGR